MTPVTGNSWPGHDRSPLSPAPKTRIRDCLSEVRGDLPNGCSASQSSSLLAPRTAAVVVEPGGNLGRDETDEAAHLVVGDPAF